MQLKISSSHLHFFIISLAYVLGGHHHGHSHDEEHDHSHVENETGESLPHKVKPTFGLHENTK